MLYGPPTEKTRTTISDTANHRAGALCLGRASGPFKCIVDSVLQVERSFHGQVTLSRQVIKGVAILGICLFTSAMVGLSMLFNDTARTTRGQSVVVTHHGCFASDFEPGDKSC